MEKEEKKLKFKPSKTLIFFNVLISPLLIMWWVWLFNGTFEDVYPAVGSFIAIYGFFFGSILQQLQIYRRIKRLNEKEKN